MLTMTAVAETEAGSVLKNQIFTEQKYFEAEISKIWEQSWIFAIHVSEVPNKGDYRLVRVGTRWIVVLRDGEGRLRAYHNTCRHRGAPVVRNVAGNTRSLRCAYHLWTYNLGGKLLGQGADLTGVPDWGGYENAGVCKEDFPLQEVHARELFGLVFVSLAKEPEDFDAYFGDIATFLRDIHHPITTTRLEAFHYHQSELRTNWKLFSDNNREGYHAYLHYLLRRSAKALLHGKQDGHVWRFFRNGHQFFGKPEAASIAYNDAGYDDADMSKLSYPLPGCARGSNFIAYFFPDVMINVRSNAIRIDRLTPLGPGTTLAEWRHLGVLGDTEEARSVRVKNANTPWGPFGRNLPEDMMIVEEQWRQMSSDPTTTSLIARVDENGFTDDVSLRRYYQEYARRIGMTESIWEPRN